MVTEGREVLFMRAERLANLISDEAYKLRHKPLNEAGLGSMLSFFQLQNEWTGKNIATLEPRIREIILFGSVAMEKENPGDIDMMIIDNGHFSIFLACMKDGNHAEGDDWYGSLVGNLSLLMEMWFDISDERLEEILEGTKVDLHVLPIDLLKSQDFREEAIQRHKDPAFFKNALGNAMRFDYGTREFVPLTLEYLEERYACDLTDLR